MFTRQTAHTPRRALLTKPFWLAFFALNFLLLLPPCAQGQRRANEKQLRKREVVDVRIEGNQHIPTNELSFWVTTRPSWWFDRSLNFLVSSLGRPRQYVDDAMIASDTESLSEYYRANGYLEVRITARFDENPGDAAEWIRIRDLNRFRTPSEQIGYPDVRTTVVFVIEEGPVYTVAGFAFEGLETLPLDLLTRVTDDLGIKRGSEYSADAVIREDERVRSILGENGYPYFRRDSIVVESIAGTKTVAITVYFQTGRRYRMGELKIIYDTLGATGRVKESTIRRQIPYEKGSWIKLSTLTKGERNLYTLGTFDVAFIYPDTSVVAAVPDSLRDSLELPIIVELRMQVTVDIAPGLFVASGKSNNLTAGGSIAFNHRNLFGGGEKFSVQGSIQPFPSSQMRGDAGLSLDLPYFGLIRAPLGLGGNFAYIEVHDRFLERSYSGRIASRISFANTNITVRPGVTLEYLQRRIFDPAFIASLQLPNNEQFNLILSTTASYDVTNDFFNPSTGINISYGFEWGTPALQQIFGKDLPSAHYFKHSLQIRKFFDLDGEGKSVLAVRGLGGKVYLQEPTNSARDIPLIRRFFIGGPSSLRGWSNLTLIMANSPWETNPDLGGYTTIEGSIEWRYAPFRYEESFSTFQRLLSDIRTAVFFDAGNLWYKGTPIMMKNFALDGGFGVRYNTLFGAIRVDMGFKLYDPAPCLWNGDKDPPASPINIPGVWIWQRGGYISNHFWDIAELHVTLGLPF